MNSFFEPGRAYTTQTGYTAPERTRTFACTAVTTVPSGAPIAFGFLRTQARDWTPTGLGTDDYETDRWAPTALPSWFAPGAAAPSSPLARADAAKRRRDIVGEVGALMDGHAALTSAPWYPARPGDLVHVHYEGTPNSPAWGETYLVARGADRLLTLQPLACSLPADSIDPEGWGVGCYAVTDDPDPLAEMWMEAGPDRLTIVRKGQVVHHGSLPVWPRTTMDLARTLAETHSYLERGDVGAARARVVSVGPLPPCGAPGIMPEHAPCARPRGHSGFHSDNADAVDPPHECPALPDQVHAVVTVDSKADHVHFAGVLDDRAAAVDLASGFIGYSEDVNERHVKRYVHGGALLELPQARQQPGLQLVAVVPLPVLPDPAAEDARAEEGRATALGPDDYADDVDADRDGGE